MGNERNCYCGLWATNPEVLREQNVPEGFCGFCQVCNAPGHLRHAPDGPYTAAWCDRHFGLRRLGAFAVAGALVAVILAIAFFAAR